MKPHSTSIKMKTAAYNGCLIAVPFLVMLIATTNAAIQCNDAVSKVLPCESFLLSRDTVPSKTCCTAVRSLDGIASNSLADRKAICECFKQTAQSLPVNLAKAQQLPHLCRVSIPVTIDPNIDCARI